MVMLYGKVNQSCIVTIHFLDEASKKVEGSYSRCPEGEIDLSCHG